ncbi:MAG: hypothetical protein Kow0074_14940 [Candidatus Zixiibacteriota bacterium]
MDTCPPNTQIQGRRNGLDWCCRGVVAGLLLVGMTTVGNAEIDVTLDDADRAVYDSLRSARIDPDRSYAVIAGSRWETPLGTYTFQSGVLSFFRQVDGRPSGCYFHGDGTFEFVPPSHLERNQLARFCDDSILATDVSEFYARFFDSATATALANCADTALRKKPEVKRSRLEWFAKNARRHLTLECGARGWEMAVNTSPPTPWLYICPILKGQGYLHFYYDATGHEPVTLWQRPGGITDPGVVDLVCSFPHRHIEDDSVARRSWLDGGIDIESYTSTIGLKSVGDMSLDVSMRCLSRRDGLVALPFTCAPDLEFDSILVDGADAPFIYNDDGGWMLVRSPKPMERGDSFAVRMFYHGNHLLEKFPWGSFHIRHTTRWLPKTADRWRADYTTTFRYPDYYDVVSVGRPVADSTSNGTRITTWQSIGKVAYISFNFGSFDIIHRRMADGTDLQIYRGKNHRDGLFSSNYMEIVASDIEGALQLFNHAFGPYPWEHLAATEIPASHGQGFPQMLHLSYGSFQLDRKGITDIFRAHEVAHQWFGHIVGWESYRDQWLSEGLAEYAGAMYVQERNKGDDDFLNVVKRWRDQIFQRGGRDWWHDGPGVAPISLGFRCSSRRSPASYFYLVYGKGAYVVHMLRYMMRDYQRRSDEPFWRMMTDYVNTYRNQDASTEDFQAIVEKHTHQSMDWFFDQWVHGTQIPRFEYSWSREQTDDGRWTVHGVIEQFDTQPPFRAYMPITIDFGNGIRRTFVQLIDGKITTFDTPPVARKPQEVIFNDYHTVLCREKVVEKP